MRNKEAGTLRGPCSGQATTRTHHRELLASCFPEGFSPPDLAWVSLLLKVFMTLGFAESEHLAIVADEHHSVPRVDRPGAEITLFDPHVDPAWDPPSGRGAGEEVVRHFLVAGSESLTDRKSVV